MIKTRHTIKIGITFGHRTIRYRQHSFVNQSTAIINIKKQRKLTYLF